MVGGHKEPCKTDTAAACTPERIQHAGRLREWLYCAQRRLTAADYQAFCQKVRFLHKAKSTAGCRAVDIGTTLQEIADILLRAHVHQGSEQLATWMLGFADSLPTAYHQQWHETVSSAWAAHVQAEPREIEASEQQQQFSFELTAMGRRWRGQLQEELQPVFELYDKPTPLRRTSPLIYNTPKRQQPETSSTNPNVAHQGVAGQPSTLEPQTAEPMELVEKMLAPTIVGEVPHTATFGASTKDSQCSAPKLERMPSLPAQQKPDNVTRRRRTSFVPRRLAAAAAAALEENKAAITKRRLAAAAAVALEENKAAIAKRKAAATLQLAKEKDVATNPCAHMRSADTKKSKEPPVSLAAGPPSKRARMSHGTVNAVRWNTTKETCAICCNDMDERHAVRLACGHGWYCVGCIEKHTEARLSLGNSQVPCPSCSTPIPERHVRRLVTPKLLDRLLERSLELAVSVSPDLRACPTPGCPMRVAIEKGALPRLKCSICRKVSCLLCGAQPYHVGATCEEFAAASRGRRRGKAKAHDEGKEGLRQWMESTGSKQCPTCSMAVTKHDLANQSSQRSECHKMLCRMCGTRFCFRCLAVLSETYTCGCSKDAHGFVDPRTGKRRSHLRRVGSSG